MQLKKLPLINRIYHLFELQQQQIDKLNFSIIQLCDDNINLKRQIKILKNEKINVIFICWRPTVWNSIKTVYEAMKADSNFNVKIVIIPNKKELKDLYYNHEIYESEGAEQFWHSDDVINGYDYESKEWINLKSLNPDYVCFQQPYNICRPSVLKSNEVSKYCKLFYIEYGYNTNKKIAINCIPKDFIKDVSLFFLQNKTEEIWYKEYFKNIKNIKTKCFVSGFPRFDNLKKYKNNESDCWKNNHSNRFRILWTPRWCLNENNSHYFKYNNFLFKYFFNNNNFDFVFRPHPQAFDNWISESLITKEEIENLKKSYDESTNLFIDFNNDYLNTFYSSDCLITDYTSLIGEYFLTEKPIIYCYNEKSLVDPEGNITKGLYYVKNWDELKNTIEMLQSGNDPLKEIRKELIKSEFLISNESCGEKIKDIIKDDFYK